MGNKKLFVIGIAIFITGLLTGMLVKSLLSHPQIFLPEPIRQGGFRYISPLLYYDIPSTADSPSITNLHSELEDMIQNNLNANNAENISVYFRIPENGEWFAINDTDTYSPASLLKVPTMMMLYKQAEKNPSFLSSTVDFTGPDDNEGENIKPTEVLQPSKTYTVNDLIDHMITQSDNSAQDLLLSNVSHDAYNKIFEDLDVGKLDYNKPEDFMTVDKYALFFRALYNATYLSRDFSEKALALLSTVKFSKGITGGIPKKIPVAHKFGERSFANVDTKQLHDCGIVYYPYHPYLLCIMTRGTDFGSLESIIQTVSKKTYSAVNEVYTHKSK